MWSSTSPFRVSPCPLFALKHEYGLSPVHLKGLGSVSEWKQDQVWIKVSIFAMVGRKMLLLGLTGHGMALLFSLLWILSSQLSCQRWISPCIMPPGWKYLVLNTSLQQKETKQVFAPLGVTWFMLAATAEFLYERLYFLSLCPAYGSVTQLLLFYFYIERWQLVGIFPQFASVAFHVSTVWVACVVSKAGRWFFPLCFIRSVTETSLKAEGEVGRGVPLDTDHTCKHTWSPTWELHSTVTDFTVGTDRVTRARLMEPSGTDIQSLDIIKC